MIDTLHKFIHEVRFTKHFDALLYLETMIVNWAFVLEQKTTKSTRQIERERQTER